MDCARSQELLSDHLEGTLHAILRSELDAHLAGCGDCRFLREAVAEVVDALHAFPDLEPPVGLAQRVVAATRAVPRPAPRPVVVRPALVIPSWMQAAAAGFALITLGVLLMVVGPEAPTRAATKLVDRTVSAGSEIIQHRDRMVEDVRILGVVLTTAFEGRLERMNDRVEDYRQLLERRRAGEQEDSKRGSGIGPRPTRVAVHPAFRTGVGADS
ncbi:MAG: zf-HC2 domain-containing protein [Acidobacteria bacterium]|jgi:anti-sigma factor RsiW|nr:zf-HC2 domain-containing protein [Acidobacteriota bacterium]